MRLITAYEFINLNLFPTDGALSTAFRNRHLFSVITETRYYSRVQRPLKGKPMELLGFFTVCFFL